MTQMEVIPDVYSYSIIINGLCKNHHQNMSVLCDPKHTLLLLLFFFFEGMYMLQEHIKI